MKVSSERSLYPSTLIHFTREYSTLIEILKCSYFRASHSNEEIYGSVKVKSRKFAIPMVSFCDIRISHLMEHTSKYGGFGIGLKKSWGVKNGLNPVFYINSDCSMIDYFNETLRTFKEKYLSDLDDENYYAQKKIYRALINPFRYMKNYEGTLNRKNQEPILDYRFANENEWRYVPDIRSNIAPIRFRRNKKKGDEKIRDCKEAILHFSYEDIKYIFVEDESYLNEIVKDINTAYSGEIKNKLLSKIFVTSNIFNDL
ncbi:abortive infection system antitoxin AbiGi family protein [Aeromonas oralensis]|uniref:abortive infection system antitoxin AbiGi family protein n=1 Tax=Aeromonas oralensis TaxID=3415010 RepID=UPI003D3DEDC7